MGKRKIKILETAASAVAEVSFFIEGKGLPKTAKKFVDDAFEFFDTLADERLEHHRCTYQKWKDLNYRCVTYKKYVIAYLSLQKEIVICNFVASKLLR
ncbi:MAG: hypothetical protein M3Y85_04900 [Bacteroidota bacterium]|nr:hypothetical protein [Bacteroidota bacterium]